MPPRAARMELVVKDQQFREGNQKQKEQLRFNFHAFGGGANFGIVVARFGDDLVDDGVGVVGVVMEKDEFLGAAFHDDVDGFAPVAVAPAAAVGSVFFGKILRVVD